MLSHPTGKHSLSAVSDQHTARSSTLISLVRFSLILTLVVIILGAYTRLSDAGLGCPDWPGCYGHYTVPLSEHALKKAEFLYPHLDVEPAKAWAEMIHRYFAGTLGLVVFTITTLCIRYRPVSAGLPILISVIVIFQALLGMWTVTLKLLPLVVMGHLLGGFSLLCALYLLYWQLKPGTTGQPLNRQSGALRVLAGAALIVVVGQIMLGGWTSSNYAALMCSSLPICEGNWTEHLDFKTAFTPVHYGHDSYEYGVLDYGPRLTIHVAHRLGAILTIALLGLLILRLRASGANVIARHLVITLTVQVTLGMANVVMSLPLWAAVLHNLGAAFLLLAVVKCNYQLWGYQRWSPDLAKVSHE